MHAAAVEAVREGMLRDGQAERVALAERLRQAERTMANLELAERQAGETRLIAEQARESALNRLEAAQAAQKRMLKRVTPLIAALREKTEEAGAKTTLVADLESRLEERTRALDAATRSADGRASALTAELETERARRTMAEGALAEGRDRRAAQRATAEGAADEAPWRNLDILALSPPARTRAPRLNARLKRPSGAGHAA